MKVLLVALLLSVSACDDEAGTLDHRCKPDGTCAKGLVCWRESSWFGHGCVMPETVRR